MGLRPKSISISSTRMAYFAYFCVVTLVYVGLIILQLTTSSMGILSESGSKDSSIIYGEPLRIRGDEYLRASPSLLAESSPIRNTNSEVITPFDIASTTGSGDISLYNKVRQFTDLDGQVFEVLDRYAPRGSALAARWWWYTYILFLSLPLLFLLLNLNFIIGIAITFLIAISPSNTWWSNWQIIPVALSALAASFGLLGSRFIDKFKSTTNSTGRKLSYFGAGIFFIIYSGLNFSRLPFSYQPWSIPVTLVIGTIFLTGLLANRNRKTALLVVLSIGTIFIFMVWWQLFDQSKLWQVVTQTEYPGKRRSAGSSSINIWTGSFGWSISDSENSLVSGNQSENALGLTIASIFSFLVMFTTYKLRKNVASKWWILTAGSISYCILILWVSVVWPSVLLKFNPLTIAPPGRVAQILGLLALVLYGIALSIVFKSESNKNEKHYFIFSFLISIYLTLNAGETYRNTIDSTILPREIWLTAFIVAAVFLLPFIFSNTNYSLVPLLIFGLIIAKGSLPVMQGPGPLVNSKIAKTISEAAKLDSRRWATDTSTRDALIYAANVRRLSDTQANGPNEKYWMILDPSKRYLSSWNRGASYVKFDWISPTEEFSISNPSHDVITIKIDPCDPRLNSLELGWILTSEELSGKCLTLFSNEIWEGVPIQIYNVNKG